MTIELVDSDTRLLITLKSGWGIKLNPSDFQEIADALAEQGITTTRPEPITAEAVEKAAKPDLIIEACGACRYYGEITGICKWGPSPEAKSYLDSCGQFKREPKGSET